jgi:hypothetical protein
MLMTGVAQVIFHLFVLQVTTDQIIFRLDRVNLRCTSEALLVVLEADEQGTVVAFVAEIDYDNTSAIIRLPSAVTTQNAENDLQGHLKCPASKNNDENLKFSITMLPSTPSVSDVFPLRMMMDSTESLGGNLLNIRITGVNSFPASAKVGRQSMHITIGETEMLVLQATGMKGPLSAGELKLVALIPQFLKGGHVLKVHFQDPTV